MLEGKYCQVAVVPCRTPASGNVRGLVPLTLHKFDRREVQAFGGKFADVVNISCQRHDQERAHEKIFYHEGLFVFVGE